MTRFQGHASPFNTGLVLLAIVLCLAVFAVLVWVSLSEAGKALDRRLLLVVCLWLADWLAGEWHPDQHQ